MHSCTCWKNRNTFCGNFADTLYDSCTRLSFFIRRKIGSWHLCFVKKSQWRKIWKMTWNASQSHTYDFISMKYIFALANQEISKVPQVFFLPPTDWLCCPFTHCQYCEKLQVYEHKVYISTDQTLLFCYCGHCNWNLNYIVFFTFKTVTLKQYNKSLQKSNKV